MELEFFFLQLLLLRTSAHALLVCEMALMAGGCFLTGIEEPDDSTATDEECPAEGALLDAKAAPAKSTEEEGEEDGEEGGDSSDPSEADRVAALEDLSEADRVAALEEVERQFADAAAVHQEMRQRDARREVQQLLDRLDCVASEREALQTYLDQLRQRRDDTGEAVRADGFEGLVGTMIDDAQARRAFDNGSGLVAARQLLSPEDGGERETQDALQEVLRLDAALSRLRSRAPARVACAPQRGATAQIGGGRRPAPCPKGQKLPRPSLSGTFGISAIDEERVQALLAMPVPVDPEVVSIAPGDGFMPSEGELARLRHVEAKLQLALLSDDHDDDERGLAVIDENSSP